MVWGYFSKSEPKKKEQNNSHESSENEPTDNFMKSYLERLPKESPDNLTFDTKLDQETIKNEAEKLKERYQTNPVQVTLEKSDIIEDARPKVEFTKEEKKDIIALAKNPDVKANYKLRKERINEMALENCSEFEVAYQHCIRHGSILDRLQMCSVEYSKFRNCVSSQKEILDKVGFAKISNHPKVDAQLAEAAYDVIESENIKEQK